MKQRIEPLVRRVLSAPLGIVGFMLIGLTVGLVYEGRLGSALSASVNTEGPAESQAGKAPVADAAQESTPSEMAPVIRGESAEYPMDTQSLVVSGPALDVPKEVLTLLDKRKRFLDQREEALHVEQGRLTDLKRALEALLERYEASVKVYEAVQARAREERKAKEDQAKKKNMNEAADQKASIEAVTKIYEAMPSEEAAVRIEKMPTGMAVTVLRSVKSKTAGAILAQVRPDKAAKLTEQLFVPPSKPVEKPETKPDDKPPGNPASKSTPKSAGKR